MLNRIRSWMIGVVLVSLFFTATVQATMVQVVGVFPGAAIVVIDGQQRMLKVGRVGPKGVRLISVGGAQAVLWVDGEAKTFFLSRQGSKGYKKSNTKKKVKLMRHDDGHFYVKGLINGRTARMVLDTGATVVGMSSDHADALGLDYTNGEPISISTANGKVGGFLVTLKSVTIDGLEIKNVDAAIHMGSHPSIILLGVSFLRRVKMYDEGDELYLESRL